MAGVRLIKSGNYLWAFIVVALVLHAGGVLWIKTPIWNPSTELKTQSTTLSVQITTSDATPAPSKPATDKKAKRQQESVLKKHQAIGQQPVYEATVSNTSSMSAPAIATTRTNEPNTLRRPLDLSLPTENTNILNSSVEKGIPFNPRLRNTNGKNETMFLPPMKAPSDRNEQEQPGADGYRRVLVNNNCWLIPPPDAGDLMVVRRDPGCDEDVTKAAVQGLIFRLRN